MDKGKGLATMRILLGAGFLYAGLEKVFDFTASGKPFSAAGFLQFGTGGTLPGVDAKTIVNPTHDLWVSLAGNPGLISVINFMVVAGELAVGIALILGFATRFAGVAGRGGCATARGCVPGAAGTRRAPARPARARPFAVR